MSEILSQIHFINEEIKRLKKEKELLLESALKENILQENEYYVEIKSVQRIDVDKDKLYKDYPEAFMACRKETTFDRKQVKIDKEKATENFAKKLESIPKKEKTGDRSWRISM